MYRVVALSNNKIKEIKKLHLKKYRDELGLFIVEGEKALEEIINANVQIIDIYSVKELNIDSPQVQYISENDMKKISTTSSACEVLTIAKKRKISIKDLESKNKIILLDSVSDPGNLGTIIRSAAAFGVDGIILFGNCVELYSSKVIRSSAGNFFKLPIVQVSDVKKYFPEHKLIATALSEKSNITFGECKKLKKYIVMFGSEANGLSDDLIKISDKNLRIDMSNNVESLNLAVTASIVLYELNN